MTAGWLLPPASPRALSAETPLSPFEWFTAAEKESPTPDPGTTPPPQQHDDDDVFALPRPQRVASEGSLPVLAPVAGSGAVAPAAKRAAAADSCTPLFHVMPLSGWGSDPNGPIFYKGRYHLPRLRLLPLPRHTSIRCCAICDLDDELLVRWRKVPMPLMELPHTGQLTAWRDPWFVETGDGCGRQWTMLIGSGLKGAGGTALVYRSHEITKGWRFEGHLCSWPNPGTGTCWECPFLVQLQPLPLCARVLPTTDLAAVAAAVPAADTATQQMAALAAPAVSWLVAAAAAAQAADGGGAAGGGGGGVRPGVWIATANDASTAGAVVAAAKAVAAAAEGASPDAVVAAVATAVAAAAAAEVGAQAAPATIAAAAASAAPDAGAADADARKPGAAASSSGSCGTASSDSSPLRPLTAEDPFAGLGLGLGRALDLVMESAEEACGQQRKGEGRGGDDGPPAANGPAPHVAAEGEAEPASPRLGFVRRRNTGTRVLHMLSSSPVTGTAAPELGGGPAGDVLTAAAGKEAGDGIDISVTAASAPPDGPGGDGQDASRVTITVTRSVAPGGAGVAAADGAAVVRPPASRQLSRSALEPIVEPAASGGGNVTTATATVQGGGSDGTPATATVHLRRTRARPRLSYSPGVVGHAAVAEPDTEVVALPHPLTMRYHKAQPLQPPPGCPSHTPSFTHGAAATPDAAGATAAAASCLPRHADVDSSSSHAHAPSLPESRRWLFCCAPDACTYSIIYWIGEYDSCAAKYDMQGAQAGGRPRKLDMGNVLYAPTCFKDPQGRSVLWGYVKELRNTPPPPCLCNKYSYAGCLSLPRALYIRGDKLFQDLHSMVMQVMAAHRARAEAAAAAAASLSPATSFTPADGGGVALERAAAGDAHAAGGGEPRLSYSPGVVGHAAVAEPDTEVVALPHPLTMRYHKAQPLQPPPGCPSHTPSSTHGAAATPDAAGATAAAASCLPRHADVDSSSSHAHAPSLPESRRWLFCCAPDACTYSIIYWIGEYDSCAAKYDMQGAQAGGRPRKLDMGNVLYAPTCFKDPQGRSVLWGYVKELRNTPPPPCLCNKYSYAGCLSLPRALYIRGDKLFQLPLPELTSLRSDVAVHASRVPLAPGSPWRLGGVRGLHLDIELAVSPGTARRTVLLLHSWRPRGRGAAALVYDWPTRRLYIVFEALARSRQRLWREAPPPDMATPSPDGSGSPQQPSGAEAAHRERDETEQEAEEDGGVEGAGGTEGGSEEDEEEDEEENTEFDVVRLAEAHPDMNPLVEEWIRMRRDEAGGELDAALMPPGAPLRLRLFLDASCLEVFTGTGQALTTRVYRGHPPDHQHQQPEHAAAAEGSGGAEGPEGGSASACPPAPPQQPGPDPGIELLAVGGGCTLDDLHAYE
ncbi:hypothetical protein TSOC_008958, partial [Tetrabaena socialis]